MRSLRLLASQSRTPQKALWYYNIASNICQQFGIYEEEALIHCKMVYIYMYNLRNIDQAMVEAEKAILLNADHHEVSTVSPCMHISYW